MTDTARHAWELMKKLDFCTLVSSGGSGMQGRPMSSIVEIDEGRIYFLSSSTARQNDAITDDPNVLLAYGDGKTYVCATGKATIISDRATIKRLWNVGAQAAWPEGPDTAPVVVISVDPEAAEYWEGSNAVVVVAKMMAALATGSTADFGDNEKVRL